MKEIRKLNKQGMEKFAKFIEAYELGQKPPIPNELKRDDRWTNVLGRGSRELDSIDFSSQWSMSRDLLEIFKDAGLKLEQREDPGMWTWLSLVFFEQICPKAPGGGWKPGPLTLWIPSTNWRRFYRHFLAGPFRIYSMHQSDPGLTRPLLNGAPNKQTEIYAQIAASQEVVQSKGVLGTVKGLYWDKEAEILKRGHAGKGAGSVRRLPLFLNQIALTWDLNDISAEELLELMPTEFDRYRPEIAAD